MLNPKMAKQLNNLETSFRICAWSQAAHIFGLLGRKLGQSRFVRASSALDYEAQQGDERCGTKSTLTPFPKKPISSSQAQLRHNCCSPIGRRRALSTKRASWRSRDSSGSGCGASRRQLWRSGSPCRHIGLRAPRYGVPPERGDRPDGPSPME
jgi:hypothetical protein